MQPEPRLVRPSREGRWGKSQAHEPFHRRSQRSQRRFPSHQSPFASHICVNQRLFRFGLIFAAFPKIFRSLPRAPPNRLLAICYSRSAAPGCRPARWGKTNKHTIINAAMIPDASGRLKFKPPALTGLSRKSPTVAPNGRVRMNAAQKSNTRERLVHK